MARISTEIRKKAFLKALEKSLGVITDASRKSDIPRRTVYNWISDDPEFAAAVNGMDDVVLDFAESKLFKLIANENVTAIIFYLKTKGKRRGYIERQELAVDVDKLSDAQIDELLDRALQKLQDNG